MKVKIILYALLLSNFSFSHGAESPIAGDLPMTDEVLQKLIRGINDSSLSMVDFVKKQANINYVNLTPLSMKLFLHIDQKTINTLFLQYVEDDQLRPLLFSIGADIKTLTTERRNCLWQTKKPELLTQLIQKGAEVDILDIDGITRLHNLLYFLNYSDAQKNILAARALLKNGANPNILKSGYSLLHKIAECTNSDIRLEAATLLCEYNADPNIESLLNETPLTNAIKANSLKLVDLLLANKALADTPNKNRVYPLHIALEECKSYACFDTTTATVIPAIVILLLKHKANPNRPYLFTNNTPLHVAVARGQREIIKALIEHGADKHCLNRDGHTAFDLAQPESLYKHLTKEIVDLLIPGPNEIMTFSTTDYVETQKNSQTPRTSSTNNSDCSLQ